LSERRSKDDVNALDGASLQRLTADAASIEKARVQGVDGRRGEVGDQYGVEVRMKLTVEHRAGLANGRRRPSSCGNCEPLLQEFADGRSGSDARASADIVDHRSEFAFCLSPVTPDGLGAVTASTRFRIGTAMGNERRAGRLEIGLYQGGLERTTGFEPATLTLAT
jgi:hypothetical protein